MSIVIGVSGKINSGKTTIAEFIANELDFDIVSFGKYVKDQATRRGIENTRENLQNLGQFFFEEDAYAFSKNVLYSGNWDGKSNLVVDGIRHITVYNEIKKLIQPLDLYLIYISTDDNVRENRLKNTNMHDIDHHPTEHDVKSILPAVANYVVNGNKTETTIKPELKKWISNLL